MPTKHLLNAIKHINTNRKFMNISNHHHIGRKNIKEHNNYQDKLYQKHIKDNFQQKFILYNESNNIIDVMNCNIQN